MAGKTQKNIGSGRSSSQKKTEIDQIAHAVKKPNSLSADPFYEECDKPNVSTKEEKERK